MLTITDSAVFLDLQSFLSQAGNKLVSVGFTEVVQPLINFKPIKSSMHILY